MNEKLSKYENEKILNPTNGMVVLFIIGLLLIGSIVLFVFSLSKLNIPFYLITMLGSILSWMVLPVFLCGLHVINPKEAGVYVLFGKYYGTIKESGFYWINPFCVAINPTIVSPTLGVLNANNEHTSVKISTSKKISLKSITLNNGKQKVNDKEGNPIEIGVIVIWKVLNPTKAVFEVENYISYISTQTDASIRQVARQYPYDISDEGDEKSLRGSSSEVANELRNDLQNRVAFAGIEIIEARIAHLAYSQEIAAVMLQRQQATAIIAARQKIVEGAVGMVEMAINKLSENEIVNLDDERKATMVSNLLVVLCGNKDAQPIVNSGSIY